MEMERSKIENFVQTSFQSRLEQREKQAGIVPADKLTTPEARALQYENLGKMIGNTPLLRFDAPNGSTILVKDESQNPGESHYDRVYLQTIKGLEDDGVIKPGDELWEVTSGSAGISFTWLANRLGYKTVVHLPARLPMARKQEMINFGAKVVEVSKIIDGVDGVYIPEASTQQTKDFVSLKKKEGYAILPAIGNENGDYYVRVADKEGEKRICLVNHSWNNITHKALESIGDEVSRIIPRGVNIDYFVSILGNGSNTRGVSDGLHRRFTAMKVAGVEDITNPVQYIKKYPERFEQVFGHKPTFEPQAMIGSSSIGTDIKFIDVNALDDIQLVERSDWQKKMEEYNKGKQPGEIIGRTSAASLIVAEKMAAENPGSIVLALFYDKGDRYSNLILDDDFTQDFSTLPPPGWYQEVAESPIDLLRDLRQTHKSGEDIRKENLREKK